MNLQVHTADKGWFCFLDFDAERIHEIEDAAASLARASGHWRWRIVDADGTVRELNRNGVFRERAQ